MTWRPPHPRHIVTSPAHPTHGEAAVFRAEHFWCCVSPVPPHPALRVRAGAREACRRLRQERDAYAEVLDLCTAERDDTCASLARLTLEAHAALDRAGVPESLPYYGPESADDVERMAHRCPRQLGVAERIEELRVERDAARAELADTKRALDHLTHNYCRLFGLSMNELVELYRGAEAP